MEVDSSEVSGSSSVSSMFSSFQNHFSDEQEVRENIKTVVRGLEQTAREIIAILQGVHQNPQEEVIKAVCTKSREMLSVAKTQYADLATKIQAGEYYRFCDHWRIVHQRFAFIASFIVYLETEALISREEVAAMLNVKLRREEGFHIDLDDYLIGLLSLAGELSRMAVNSVTARDYGRPLRIANFISELDAGFRLLNLKNDFLRKRFDGLKYDMKKVEEVVYDLSIRGLKPDTESKKPE